MPSDKNKKIVVLSKSEVKNFTSDLPYVVISIENSANDRREFQNDKQRKALLCVNSLDENIPNDVNFSINQANDILEFVEKYLQTVDLIVIHCHGGNSRSRGIALGISLIYDLDIQEHLDNGWANPLFVWRLLSVYEQKTHKKIPMPKLYRDLVQCSIHPGGYHKPYRDNNNDILGFCNECSKEIPGANIDIFALWMKKNISTS